MAESGVLIHNRFYSWPQSFRHGDPVLVREVTGMSWPDFLSGLQAQEQMIREKRTAGEDVVEADIDAVIQVGLLAVAFWQGNPMMSREKVRRAIERLPQEAVEYVDGDEEDDERPPEVAAGEPPPTSSSGSGDSPEARAGTEIPAASI